MILLCCLSLFVCYLFDHVRVICFEIVIGSINADDFLAAPEIAESASERARFLNSSSLNSETFFQMIIFPRFKRLARVSDLRGMRAIKSYRN